MKELKRYSLRDILQMERFFRMHFVNTVSGYKSAHLIGTLGHRGTTNLGIFNSLIHLGASPPLLGFSIRPLTVPRHTYHNILAKRFFTVNHVNEDILPAAHQTSANYSEDVSEFEACGLTPWYSEQIGAPYVAESKIGIGLEFIEEHHIRANGTILIVGKVVEIFVPEQIVEPSGHIDLPRANSVAAAGLDTYYTGAPLGRMAYARPGKKPSWEEVKKAEESGSGGGKKS